ncbi:hypothetical protein DVH24_008402 [Malus domestica]|uniref:Uncharacterized protein n=1 Tax=Malus domestica TaxID=3750 RepID=A0A498JQM8_MALDO|nr:hypothetical protein DVH24_008402 [Malus domestica]
MKSKKRGAENSYVSSTIIPVTVRASALGSWSVISLFFFLPLVIFTISLGCFTDPNLLHKREEKGITFTSERMESEIASANLSFEEIAMPGVRNEDDDRGGLGQC